MFDVAVLGRRLLFDVAALAALAALAELAELAVSLVLGYGTPAV